MTSLLRTSPLASHTVARRFGLLAAGVMMTTLLSAAPVTITTSTAPFAINFDGRVGSFNTVVNGLTAQATFTFNGFNTLNGTTYANFNVLLSNTSSSPVTASRVSVLGFDVLGATLNVGGSSVSGLFDTVSSGNMPMVPNDPDICFTSNNCAGGANGGVTKGNSGTFSVSLALSNFTTPSQFQLDNFLVRYQSLEVAGGQSGVGVGTLGSRITATPEPSSMALLGFGLCGIGVAMRRRRQA